jgi:hypothetical protein
MAGVGIDLHFPGARPGTELASENRERLARQFIAIGIDDLAKFRVIRLLYDYQSLAGDVTLFASYLGFHSLEVTTTTLNELVSHGILTVDRARGRRPRYRLADDSEARRRLVKLYNTTIDSYEWARTLQVFARRSLEKARVRASVAAKRPRATCKRERGNSLGRNDVTAPSPKVGAGTAR